MATIEPRLIHLLNNSNTPELSSIDLPPFHLLPLPNSTDGLLPPLEQRDAGHRADKSLTEATHLHSPHHLAGEDESFHDGHRSGSLDTYPGRSLRREHDIIASTELPYSLPKILDDSNSEQKRGLTVNTGREDYLQLPQPVQNKQQPPPLHHASAFPPIINGLHEPPPDAALFPPIASDSFPTSDPSDLKRSKEQSPASDTSSRKRAFSESDDGKQKARKRATKPRRKWSEEETNHLLLGVSKHGVGKWTIILEDKAFTFNGRSAGDLKDRFRTCCPTELQASKSDRSITPPVKSPHKRAKKGLHSENILHEDDDASTQSGMITPPAEPDTTAKPKKTRAHRKRLEDLENLGIHAPFKKSVRRERRPFTDQDDREILDGLKKYGPAWTKIQRDSSFNLSSRQPTDLRDRVRNKYPQIYSSIEKGAYSAKDSAKSNASMTPLVHMSAGTTSEPYDSLSRVNSREDISKGVGSEMGISRLLLADAAR